MQNANPLEPSRNQVNILEPSDCAYLPLKFTSGLKRVNQSLKIPKTAYLLLKTKIMFNEREIVNLYSTIIKIPFLHHSLPLRNTNPALIFYIPDCCVCVSLKICTLSSKARAIWIVKTESGVMTNFIWTSREFSEFHSILIIRIKFAI